MAKTALITGASQGIGACIAKTLAAEGFNIAIDCYSEREVETAARLSLLPAGNWALKQNALSLTFPTLRPAVSWSRQSRHALAPLTHWSTMPVSPKTA